MPRYSADPTTVTAAITILPKDDYEFKIGKPKAFERTAKAGHQSYGLGIPLTVASGPQLGKKTYIRLYMHSEGAQQMTKRFQMASAGYTVTDKNEKLYDASGVAGKDWSFDTDNGEVGAAWAELEGLHICCDLDVEMVKNDKGDDIESQVWGTWTPVAGVAVG